MTVFQDRTTVIILIEKVIGNSSINQWLDDLFYSNIEDSIIEEVKKTATEIYPSMDWEYELGPVIPEERIISFLVNTCGNNLLQSVRIRKCLLDGLENLAKQDDISSFLDSQGFLDIAQFSELFINDYTPRSKACKSFCDLIGLPKSYSIRNPKIKNKPLITTRTIARLDPLIDFQEFVKNRVIQKITQNKGRALVVMPTGSGKTRTTTQAFIEAISEGQIDQNGIVWIAETVELCQQATETIVKVAERISPIQLKIWQYWGGNDCELTVEEDDEFIEGIVVCGKAQVHSRYDNHDLIATTILENASIILIDEAHRNLRFIHNLDTMLKSKNLDTALVGISATPFRRLTSEDSMISDIFPEYPITPIGDGDISNLELEEAMVTEGILARRVNKTISDLAISPRGPDVQSQMGITVEIIQKLISDEGCESILVFTPDVKWGRLCNIILSLKNPNLNSEYIHGGTSGLVRKLVIDDFRSKDCQVLFNCEILTTGFDAPRIDAVVIARPNMDPNDPLFRQMVGRGLRGPKFDSMVKPDCIIVHQKW